MFQFHLQQNARSYVSRKDAIPEVHSEIRRVFNAPDIENAERYLQQLVEKYRERQPRFSEWADENLREGFAIFPCAGKPPAEIADHKFG